MGGTGPIPKRESELQRARTRKGSDVVPVTHGALREVTSRPPADEEWHPIAKGLYESAATSGQSDFYQDSDWWMLYSLCDEISYLKGMKQRSGQYLASILSGLQALLLTEGERRRVRIELTKPEEKGPDLVVVGMADYKDKAQGAKTS